MSKKSTLVAPNDSVASKKDEIQTITVKNDVAVANAITNFVKAKADVKEATQRVGKAQDTIRPYALKHFLGLAKNGPADRSYIFDNNGSAVLFNIQDVYKTKDIAKRIAGLRKKYGISIVTTTTEYTLDPKLAKQKNSKGVTYGMMVAQFILDNPDIPENIREKLLQITPTHVITQGTIDKLADISKRRNIPLSEIVEDIGPTIQFKVADDEE